jgi:Tfp pilus assembly protein PilV
MTSRHEGRHAGARDERRAAGFLYVEVLLGLVILSMALLAVVPLFIMAARENATAGDLTFASTTCRDKVEELKAVEYAELKAGEDVVTQRTLSFDRKWVVKADDPHPGLKTVTVSVTSRRSRGFGSTRSASISFYRVETKNED